MDNDDTRIGDGENKENKENRSFKDTTLLQEGGGSAKKQSSELSDLAQNPALKTTHSTAEKSIFSDLNSEANGDRFSDSSRNYKSSKPDIKRNLLTSDGDMLKSDVAMLTSDRRLPTSDRLPLTSPKHNKYNNHNQKPLLSTDRGDVFRSPALARFLSSENDAPDQLVWGTLVNIEESLNTFRAFITTYTEEGSTVPFYDARLLNMRNTQDWALNLDCTRLEKHSPAFLKNLKHYPQELIPLMDHALEELIYERFEDLVIPNNVSPRVRPYNLPATTPNNMRDLNPADIDQLITVKGLIIRTSPVIPDFKRAFFRCTICALTIELEPDRGVVKEPTTCVSCKSRNSMMVVHNRCVFADKQVSRLQELPDETPHGQTPYTVSMCVYDDLMDVTKPGDRVEITGIFRSVPVRVNGRQRAIKNLFKTFVDIVHVKRVDVRRVGKEHLEGDSVFKEDDSVDVVENVDYANEILATQQRADLYDLLARSVAPSIFGMEDVKKGVLLQLFGGSNKFSKGEGARIRGDINILLVGDPGVSKSQLLQYVHKLAPRGVYTSGKGSSAVGLTAYITRDPDTRQLVLESGALVLSDGGICCIDEFDKMSDSTRSVLHEVMEQQTISVAKAGIITTLNARTSILACANPINSKFDLNLSVPANVNLPPPLMSRFDLMYLILDKPNESDDRKLARHLVGLYLTDRPTPKTGWFLEVESFARYISYHKKRNVGISESAGRALVDFYVGMRKNGHGGGNNVVSFTTRQLESMIRLSEAHAKMRGADNVEVCDVEEANRLVLTALQSAAVDPRTGKIDLDLVTTGISAHGRKMYGDQRNALRDLISSSDKYSLRWPELFRDFQSQSDSIMTETEFNSVLRDLVDEGLVHVNGRTNGEKIIRKLSG